MGYGQKIIQLRKNAQVTQSQLGDYLNVSAQAVSKWERDCAEPDLGTVKKICEFFKISVGEFFEDEPQSALGEEKVADVLQSEFAEKTIGYCVDCGIVVAQKDLGCQLPRVVCDRCQEKRKAIYEEQKQEEIASVESELKGFESKKKKSIIWGSIFAAFVLAAFLAGIILSGTKDAGKIALWTGVAVAVMYGAYALVGELYFGGGIVLDILEFFIASPIKLPGIIFGLDMDGLIFFVVVKVLFAILGFLFGLAMFVAGVLVGMIVSTIAFPISMSKANKEIKGLKTKLKSETDTETD